MSEDERTFMSQTRAALDEATRDLPPGVRSRLTHIRAEAVEAAGQKRGRRWFLIPAAGLVAAGLAIALTLTPPDPPAPSPSPTLAVEDLELLTDTDGLEFFDELEFYTWLAEQDDHAG